MNGDLKQAISAGLKRSYNQRLKEQAEIKEGFTKFKTMFSKSSTKSKPQIAVQEPSAGIDRAKLAMQRVTSKPPGWPFIR